MIRRVVCTGLGVVTGQANDPSDFARSLRSGTSGIGRARRPDLCRAIRVAAEVDEAFPDRLDAMAPRLPAAVVRARRALRNATFSTRISSVAAMQAFADARLEGAETARFGIVVTGNNVNQGFIRHAYRQVDLEAAHLDARYALSFQDTHLMAVLSEILEVRGCLGMSVGGASASGNVGLIQGFHAVRAGQCDVCIVVGALADLSDVELLGLVKIGALADGRFDAHPERACRPFDQDHAGFVYGQASAAVVLEAHERARARGATLLGEVLGSGTALSGSHLAAPSLESEVRAMEAALEEGSAAAERSAVRYVNAHGTSSPLGDETELAAIEAVFGEHAPLVAVNATKALTGHCLTAAGVVELVATFLQLNEGFYHPNVNLDRPLPHRVHLVGQSAEPAESSYGLSSSFGFGGIHTSILVSSAKAVA